LAFLALGLGFRTNTFEALEIFEAFILEALDTLELEELEEVLVLVPLELDLLELDNGEENMSSHESLTYSMNLLFPPDDNFFTGFFTRTMAPYLKSAEFLPLFTGFFGRGLVLRLLAERRHLPLFCRTLMPNIACPCGAIALENWVAQEPNREVARFM